MDEFIRFLCPNCQRKIKHREGGARVRCRRCGNVAVVPDRTQLPPSAPDLDLESPPPPFRVIWLALIPIGLFGITTIMSVIGFVTAAWVFGVIFLSLSLLLGAITVKIVIDLLTAKARAIERGDREFKLFFGCVKMVMWEENEGLLFLRDKKVRDVVYGPERGGGTKYIFPIIGDEWKVHIPVTLQMSIFEDRRILTREAIQLYVKIAFWWRIKDKEGVRKFYQLVDREVRQATDTGFEQVRDYGPPPLPRIRREARRAELDAAERWMRTIIESSLRKLVSKQGVAFVISREASAYLQVDTRPEHAPSIANSDSASTTPDQLADTVRSTLGREAANYGIEIERVEVQEVRLPRDIQDEIDKVWKAALAPAQTKPQAEAIAMKIKAELDAVAASVGRDAAAAGHVMSQMGQMQIVGGLPEAFQKLISRLAGGTTDLPKLTGDAPPTPTMAPEPRK